MWVYQETPEAAAGKALPEAILPTAQEEPLKQKNRGVLPETAQEERRSIPAAFSESRGNTPERAAARRSKPSEGIALLAAAAPGAGDDLICPFWGPFWRVWRQRVAWQAMPKRFPIT